MDGLLRCCGLYVTADVLAELLLREWGPCLGRAGKKWEEERTEVVEDGRVSACEEAGNPHRNVVHRQVGNVTLRLHRRLLRQELKD